MNLESTQSSKKVALHTLGCRLNFSETGSIAQGFADRGYEIVDFGRPADVVFINTCTVTDGADSTCRNLIRKAHRSSPEAKIVVAGCYAQMAAETVKTMQGVDLVLGTSEKYKVFDYLDDEKTDEEKLVKLEHSADFFGAATTPADNHTRAFLKIQDGCNYVCSFCIIPFARGRSKALPISDALENAKSVVANGFKEIILTGVNIGEYEAKSGEKLTDLLKGLDSIKGLERIRLSSVEPNTITDELLKVMKGSEKFLDHFHLPLQSGNDEILKSMRRKYDMNYYKETILKIKELFPNAGIGADVIVGYPGETEEQFQDTFNFLREYPMTHFHIFPYSQRKFTTAARLPDHIQHHVKKDRVRALNMLGDAKLAEFAQAQIGTVNKVLFEKRNKKGNFEGYTTNYVRVECETDTDLSNQIASVSIKSSSSTTAFATLS